MRLQAPETFAILTDILDRCETQQPHGLDLQESKSHEDIVLPGFRRSKVHPPRIGCPQVLRAASGLSTSTSACDDDGRHHRDGHCNIGRISDSPRSGGLASAQEYRDCPEEVGHPFGLRAIRHRSNSRRGDQDDLEMPRWTWGLFKSSGIRTRNHRITELSRLSRGRNSSESLHRGDCSRSYGASGEAGSGHFFAFIQCGCKKGIFRVSDCSPPVMDAARPALPRRRIGRPLNVAPTRSWRVGR